MTRKPATYAGLLKLPDDKIGEIVDGELYASPRPAGQHARHGVAHAWLINPATRTLEVFRREGTSWVLAASHADDAIVRAEPFAAIELDLLHLWGEERTPQVG